MSRQIDTSDLSALSKDDLEYLRARNVITDEQIRSLSAPQDGGDDSNDGAGEGDDDEFVPYEDMSKADLQAELNGREIEFPAKANKEELIALLEADDAED